MQVSWLILVGEEERLFFCRQQLRVSGGHLKRGESKVFTDSYFEEYKVPFLFVCFLVVVVVGDKFNSIMW